MITDAFTVTVPTIVSRLRRRLLFRVVRAILTVSIAGNRPDIVLEHRVQLGGGAHPCAAMHQTVAYLKGDDLACPSWHSVRRQWSGFEGVGQLLQRGNFRHTASVITPAAWRIASRSSAVVSFITRIHRLRFCSSPWLTLDEPDHSLFRCQFCLWPTQRSRCPL